MTDLTRGDDDDVGWFPCRVLRSGRRRGSSPSFVTRVDTVGGSGDLGRTDDVQVHRTSDGEPDKPVSTGKVISILALWGGLGIVFRRIFDLWVLEVAFDGYLTAAVCSILAGFLIVNFGCYELLRSLVSDWRNVAKKLCSWLRRVLGVAPDVSLSAVDVETETAESWCVTATSKLKTIAFWIWNGARWTAVYAVRDIAGGMILYAAVFIKAIIVYVKDGFSYTFETAGRAYVATVNSIETVIISIKEGASGFLCSVLENFGAYAADIVNILFLIPCRFTVDTVYFIKAKIFDMWKGANNNGAAAAADDDGDEHAAPSPWTTDEAPDATEAADVVPLRRSRRIAATTEEVQRLLQDMTLRSGRGLANTAPPQAMLHQRYVGQGEGVGDAIASEKGHRTLPPTRLLTQQHGKPVSTRVRVREKAESCMAPFPKFGLFTDSPRSGICGRFGHVSPNFETRTSLQQKLEMGGYVNSAEDHHRGSVAFIDKSNTKTKTEAAATPRGSGLCPKIEPTTGTARSLQRGRCSQVPTGTEMKPLLKPEPRRVGTSTAMQSERVTRDRTSRPSRPAGRAGMNIEAPASITKAAKKEETNIKSEVSAEIDGRSRRKNTVKREQDMVDSLAPMTGFRDGMTPQRASVGGARNRATVNTSGKNKRSRNTAAAGEKAANRRRIDTAPRVHCCQADPTGMVEMWVCAQSFDEASGKAVPGVFHYLPVTLIREVFERAADGEVYWYVQPGGQGDKREWKSEESGRVLWKVPLNSLFPKAPAECSKGCGTCGTTEGAISWTPDGDVPRRICDSCADAPRRHLRWDYDARDLGFERVRACGCLE